MTEWSAICRDTIGKVHASLPESATVAERKKALHDAYPFGSRAMWPYKAWLKACKHYMAKFEHKKPPKLAQMSPMERMMAKAHSKKPVTPKIDQ